MGDLDYHADPALYDAGAAYDLIAIEALGDAVLNRVNTVTNRFPAALPEPEARDWVRRFLRQGGKERSYQLYQELCGPLLQQLDEQCAELPR